jgi:hypothetical protein
MTEPTDSPAQASDKQPDKKNRLQNMQQDSWGPKLFIGVFVVMLVFFWWLLLYSHGVTPHHG